MIIDKKTTQIKVVQTDELLNQQKRQNCGPILGIVGIMNILGQNYLSVIQQAEQVGTLNNAKIFKLSQVKMYPFKPTVQVGDAQLVEDVKTYLEDGYYFSYGYDLTCSRQRRIKWMQTKCQDPLKLIACD